MRPKCVNAFKWYQTNKSHFFSYLIAQVSLYTVIYVVSYRHSTEKHLVEGKIVRSFFPFFHAVFVLLARVHFNGMNIQQKNSSKRSFLPKIGAQTFWTETGRVATAYSADKYKDQNEENKSAE